MRPYYESILSENVTLRGFSSQIDNQRLTWHRDEEDRIIIVVEGTGWLFQRDNEIPFLIEVGDRIKVNAGEYHRIIKGNDDLIVTIIKEKKKTKKKKQDKKIGMRSVKSGADSNPGISKTDFLPQSVLDKMAKEREEDIDEKRKRKKSGGLTRGYKANRTPASQSRLSSLTKQYRDADTKAEKMAAIRARDAFEKSQYKSKKKSKHNYKRKKKEE